eukprot:jgi/Chlat1/7304/Chrsp58S06931
MEVALAHAGAAGLAGSSLTLLRSTRRRPSRRLTGVVAALQQQKPKEGQELELAYGGKGILTGSRVPAQYFVAKGFGETDEGGGIDPWETGSYDIALEDARIHDFNIMEYTSVLPPESREVSYEEGKPYFRHGGVLEAIMAKMHGNFGERISAGVGRMHVRRKKDGFHIGGYAAEYRGHAPVDKVKEVLREDLQGIFSRRFNNDDYEMFDVKLDTIEGEIQQNYGSCLVALCFFTYLLPIHPPMNNDNGNNATHNLH